MTMSRTWRISWIWRSQRKEAYRWAIRDRGKLHGRHPVHYRIALLDMPAEERDRHMRPPSFSCA